jgi:hypothetical protein
MHEKNIIKMYECVHAVGDSRLDEVNVLNLPNPSGSTRP